MIRFVSVLVAALVSVSAQATPKIGDYSLFDLSLSRAGQTAQGTMEKELLQFNGTDYLERQTLVLNGGDPQVSEEWSPASDFLDDASIDTILGGCTEMGGTLDAVTVPAGTFNACALTQEDQERRSVVWVAKVPFGVARADQFNKADGLTVNLLLRSFR